MSLDPKIHGLGALQSAGETKAAEQDPKAGAAFRALLERLEEKTRALGEASESLDDPRRLGEAVMNARASVEEAVLLGTDLLEAYRAAQQRAAANSTTTQTDSPDGGPDVGRGAKR
jgi:hypothetical protein